MNIEQAKALSLADLLQKLGHKPMRERGRQVWYLSPLRTEKRPSFHVHLERNVWFDHGDGNGGNTLDFAIQYLEGQGKGHSVSDALRFISDVMGEVPSSSQAKASKPALVSDERLLELVNLKAVQHPALVQYLEARGISLEIAKRHLKQATVRNRETGKSFFALAFRNEEGGYELRNPYLKRSLSPKAISFIRGSDVKPDGVHVFEGFMDFLSVLTREKKDSLQNDVIVLNSLSMLDQAMAYIKGYGYFVLFTWMDNDASGDKATTRLAEFARTEEHLTHYALNQIYSGHQDVNAWHMADPGLAPMQP